MIIQKTLYFKCGDAKSNWFSGHTVIENAPFAMRSGPSYKEQIENLITEGFIIKWQFTDYSGSLFIFEKRDST